jgi:hypothetical protein
MTDYLEKKNENAIQPGGLLNVSLARRRLLRRIAGFLKGKRHLVYMRGRK